MLLSELVDSGGDVRTTKRVVVNIVVKGGGSITFIKHYYKPVDAFSAHIPHESDGAYLENNALHNA